jgi:very-short-patch-repair endonuclease
MREAEKRVIEDGAGGRQRSSGDAVIDGRNTDGNISGHRSSGGKGRDERNAADPVIAAVVRRGVVTREDLVARGVAADDIDYRVKRKRLHLFMGQGAYLVGHEDPPPLAREYAAMLIGGAKAVVSHWSAVVLHGLLREAPDSSVHLTLKDKRRSTGAITFHRGQLLRREVRTLHGDIRVTSAARTIADIAHDLDEEDLERIVADAIRRRLTTERELTRYAHGRRGAAKLRKILQLDGGAQWTRSKAEAEFLKLVRAAGLPAPRMNKRLDGKGRDAIWDAEKVIVEIDSRTWHAVDVIAFEGDRARDTGQAARGWLPMRFTFTRIRDAPVAVAAELAAALSLRRS